MKDGQFNAVPGMPARKVPVKAIRRNIPRNASSAFRTWPVTIPVRYTYHPEIIPVKQKRQQEAIRPAAATPKDPQAS